MQVRRIMDESCVGGRREDVLSLDPNRRVVVIADEEEAEDS